MGVGKSHPYRSLAHAQITAHQKNAAEKDRNLKRIAEGASKLKPNAGHDQRTAFIEVMRAERVVPEGLSDRYLLTLNNRSLKSVLLDFPERAANSEG